ncbi:hypothetical protein WMY93_033733 [Mugilogobius chulae]|uniref:Uncharacterized protein n=1 Tax=Mugilogobius chulae TaxID=88201 RepID=A0AAW0MMX8_9GOBI
MFRGYSRPQRSKALLNKINKPVQPGVTTTANVRPKKRLFDEESEEDEPASPTSIETPLSSDSFEDEGCWRSVKYTETERSSLVEKLSSYAPCSRMWHRRVSSCWDQWAQASPASSVQFSLCLMEESQTEPWWDTAAPASHTRYKESKESIRAEEALSSDTEGYIKRPGLKEQMHCVAFVLDASKVSSSSYSKGTSVFLQQLRRYISDLGEPHTTLQMHFCHFWFH